LRLNINQHESSWLVGGSLGVLLKASRVRFLSLVAIYFAATITNGEGRTREGQNRVAAYPLTFFIVVEIGVAQNSLPIIVNVNLCVI
jgi:hypothetical protein